MSRLEGIRKVLDGTIRILERKEVIARSKVVLINDVNNNDMVSITRLRWIILTAFTRWMAMDKA